MNVVHLGECSIDLEKNVYSAVVGWNTLQITIRSHWLMVQFSSTIPLLTFCLLDLLITNREVLNSLIKIVDLSVSSCSTIHFCIMYFDALLGIHAFFFCGWAGYCECDGGSLDPGLWLQGCSSHGTVGLKEGGVTISHGWLHNPCGPSGWCWPKDPGPHAAVSYIFNQFVAIQERPRLQCRPPMQLSQPFLKQCFSGFPGYSREVGFLLPSL